MSSQTLKPKAPRMVDRSIVRMIATKRIATGIVSITAGTLALIYVAVRSIDISNIKLLGVAFLAISFGGGSWSLRDGLRLNRELKKPAT
jgi:hypothetical protein